VILAVSISPVLVRAVRSQTCVVGRPACWLVTLLLASLWVIHLFTADAAPTWSLALLAGTMPIAWLAMRFSPARFPILLRAAVPLVPAITAVAIVVATMRHLEPEEVSYPMPAAAANVNVAASPGSPPPVPSGPTSDDNPFRRWAESTSEK
jgi:hypothetical protein